MSKAVKKDVKKGKPKVLNTNDIAKELSKMFGIPHIMMKNIVQAVFEEVQDSLDNGVNVNITRFGTFYSQIKEPRMFYSTMYKKDIMAKRKNRITFKLTQKLKQYMHDSICRRHLYDKEKYEDR